MILAIGGPSNAGKSDLARLISESCDQYAVKMLCQDDFVYSKKKLTKIKDHIDWELPSSINFKKFKSDMLIAATKNDLVIVEGFMVFYNLELNELYNKRIFINIQESTFRSRKRKDLRWGREPEWYLTHIWKKYKEFGQAPKNTDVLHLDGENPWPIENILNFLNK